MELREIFNRDEADYDRYRPRYFIHGHVHLNYGQDLPRLSSYGDTQVINAYETYTFEY